MDTRERVYEYIRKYNMISPGDTVIAGISGGADSMCLLFLLYQLRDMMTDGMIYPQVIHIHHGIRGKTADRDAEYVENFCKHVNIPVKTFYINVLEVVKETHETVEEAARRLRYEIFVKEAKCYDHAKIAIAHHADDQAETVLHNMFRGSALHGLTGIHPVGEREGVAIVRPLLCLRRKEIEEYLSANAIEYMTDETNEDAVYTRNRIRHNILPEAVKVNAGAVEHIAGIASYLLQVSDFIDQIAFEKFKTYVTAKEKSDTVSIDIALFSEEHDIIVQEVVRLAIKAAAGRLKDITAEHINQVIEIARNCQSGKYTKLPYNLRGIKNYDKLIIASEQTVLKEGCIEQTKYDADYSVIELNSKNKTSDYPRENYTKWFDYDKITKIVHFRTRQSGDYIVTGAGRQKLQDFFTKQKVPAIERDQVQLLVQEGDSEVIWAVSECISRINENYKVSENTDKILQVRLLTNKEKSDE